MAAQQYEVINLELRLFQISTSSLIYQESVAKVSWHISNVVPCLGMYIIGGDMHSAAKPKTHPSKNNVNIFFPLTSPVIANRAKMRNLSSANTETDRANDPEVFADYFVKVTID